MCPRVCVCIASHNQGHLLKEAIDSCMMQDYDNLHVVVLDDASTDGKNEVDCRSLTSRVLDRLSHRYKNLHYFHSNEPSGTGGAFNKAISHACEPYIDGDILVLLCADDVFTDCHVISDIVLEFERETEIGHVSRWYHQFVDGDSSPVRSWRGENVIELANNPSGMAFRKGALLHCRTGEIDKNLTNNMFVEVAQMVKQILDAGWAYSILRYDTVAVRVHKSISRTPGYYKKMWNSSPVEEWNKLGWKINDFTHLIQVGVNFEKKAVLNESINFIRINIWNLFNPAFWFFSVVAFITPSSILFKIPEWYRITYGRWLTKEVKRGK